MLNIDQKIAHFTAPSEHDPLGFQDRILDKAIELQEKTQAQQKQFDDLLDELRENENKIEKQTEQIVENVQTAKALVDQQNAVWTKTQEVEEAVDTLHGKTRALLEDLEAQKDVIQSIENRSGNAHTQTLEYEKDSEALLKAMEERDASFSEAIERIEESEQTLNQLLKDNQEAAEETKRILKDATSSKLAGSFLDRFNIAEESRKKWLKIFIWTIVGLSAMAGAAMIVVHVSEEVVWQDILYRLPILFPLIWLAWMASKNHGHQARIAEDYAFKFSVAMAFQGYKEQAEALSNTQLSERLLEETIDNFGQNPLRVYGKNLGSPIQELLQNPKLFDKVESFHSRLDSVITRKRKPDPKGQESAAPKKKAADQEEEESED